MAFSGSQKTQVGPHMASVAKKQTFTAKAAAGAPAVSKTIKFLTLLGTG